MFIALLHLKKGKFVSESKFKSHPEQFIPHIRNPNPAALEALITKPEVEAALLRRVRAKARQYGQDVGTDGRPVSPPAKMNGNGLNGTNGSGSGEDGIGKIDVNFVVELYEDYIIPLTKEVEVGTFFKSSFSRWILTNDARLLGGVLVETTGRSL